ncbi:MAG: 3-oxoacyl-[acyl-carrier-protein] reductase [Chloroflexi bacterium]|nr:3-oxoacyl-[acyl-carrier-protein] reductase [Chloroflexota bacterium]
MSLEGKVALVTGSGRGIGREIALLLAGRGVDLVITDIDEASAVKAAEEVKEKGRKAIAVKSDVSNAADVEALFKKAVDEFGRLDILVNNAGITRDTLLVRMKEEDWDAVLAVNLKGAFLCTRAAAKIMMRQRSGRIINISSVIGLMGNVGQANYSASKAGLLGLTKSAARELAPRGVTVNAVTPGFIQTDMTANLPEEVKTSLMNAVPMKKLGEPRDVAELIAFLAGNGADYITGQVIGVDGGMVMS